MNRGSYLEYRERARVLVHRRLEYFAGQYGFEFGRVAIRNQKSRWGSCSRAGNLNFNYKIVHLPEELVDYIVVHELCHLREHNHGPQFWKLVEAILPDYKERKAALHNVSRGAL